MNLFKNIPTQINRFFQNNWFSMAMFGLVFFMILRAGYRAQPENMARPTHPIDKKTPFEIVDRPTKFTEKNTEPVAPDQMSYSFLSESTPNLPAFGATEATAFLKRFAKVALMEQQKFGIPASVILAAAMVESAAGRRDLAVQGNNFFSLPEKIAGSNNQFLWQNGRKYAQFNTPWDSFRANSLFLNEKFSGLKNSAGKNWRLWSSGMVRGGYSDLPDFEARVARVILEFRLAELDK